MGDEEKTESSASGEKKSTLELLKEEIKMAKEKRGKVRVVPGLDGRGFLYITIGSKTDPVRLLRTYMADVAKGAACEAPKTRFCARITPLQTTCYPTAEAIASAVGELLKRDSVNGDAIWTSFAINVRSRMKSRELSRMDIINAIVPLIGKDRTVNLSDPDLSIYIDVCKNVAGISVILRPEELHGFNIRSFNESLAATEESKKD